MDIETIKDRLIKRTERKMQQAREAKPFEDRCSGSFPFGRCIISFSMNRVHKDIEVWNPAKDTYLDCVAELLKLSTPDFEDLEVEDTDEWDAHGFRNEADYINYKYG